jgi:DICT domain-containing protein
MQDITRVAQLVGETRDTGTELLVSFDHESMPLYLKDAFQPAPWPATNWSLRIDAPRLTPILEQLSDNRGLRLVAPRLHRAARDLRRLIGALRQAESIEATDSVSGEFEELRVRIASK